MLCSDIGYSKYHVVPKYLIPRYSAQHSGVSTYLEKRCVRLVPGKNIIVHVWPPRVSEHSPGNQIGSSAIKQMLNCMPLTADL